MKKVLISLVMVMAVFTASAVTEEIATYPSGTSGEVSDEVSFTYEGAPIICNFFIMEITVLSLCC